jgi:predicted nucleic acid-binding protein
MIVVDASLVVDLLTQAPGADRIGQRLVRDDLHAPHLLDTEVVSALRGLVLGGWLSELRAMDALTDYDDLPISRWPTTDSQRRMVLDLRDNMTAYDATYLVLASELDCPLVTRDARLGRARPADIVVEVI